MRANNKLLITGASGFIGANLAHSFLKLGYDVHIFVRRNSDLWRIREIRNKLKIHIVDLLDARTVQRVVKKIRPDVIFHCASYGGHMDSQKGRQQIFDTNVLGTVNLLQACIDTGFRCFVNTGSSSEYGEVTSHMVENIALKPNNYYGFTKAIATLYCGYIARTYKKPIITLRLFSPYGYLDSEDRLIPKLIFDLLGKRKKINLYSASAVRDYVFIDDVVEAYRMAIVKSGALQGEIFNIGNGIQRSVKDVIGQISKTLGRYPTVVYKGGRFKQYEPKAWVANISSAKRYLGWAPRHNFSSGIAKTIDWFKSSADDYDR